MTIKAKFQKKTVDDKVNTDKAAMLKALENDDYESYTTMVESLRESGVEDSKIKRAISDAYREKYQQVYLRDDSASMMEIEILLENTGFDFNFKSWRTQADKK